MGIKGKEATEETMVKNCKKAIRYGNELRDVYPNVEFYIPAEHEGFVHRAYKMGFLTIDQILQIDCDIILTCDLVILYNHELVLSSGMKIEYEFAFENNIQTVNWLACNFISDFLKGVNNE